MRYTFLLYSDPADFAGMTEADMAQQLQVFGAYIADLQAAGVFVATDWLQPAFTATTLSLKGGTRTIQDGPFAETREMLGGFFVIDVPDLDTALHWAERCPAVHYGKVEVRASAMPG